MADRDEVVHYLLNKVKSEDGWSSANVAWNEEKLAIVADLFTSFDGAAKTKVLLSFLSMTPRTIIQCTSEMQHVLRLARRDGDEWVRLFAGVLAPFPQDQSISFSQCLEGNMEGVLEEIADALSHQSHHCFVPHEYAYLNQSVLEACHGYFPPTHHEHFTLTKQPQASVQLRNEMLQRAGTDFSQTGSLVKDRHLLQRQLSSSGVAANPFVPTVRSSSTRKSVPIPGLSNKLHRERGTKLLDLNEVPIAGRRKRKATIDTDSMISVGGRPELKRGIQRQLSKVEQMEPPTPTATPDYAAGLGSEYGLGSSSSSGTEYRDSGHGTTSGGTNVDVHSPARDKVQRRSSLTSPVTTLPSTTTLAPSHPTPFSVVPSTPTPLTPPHQAPAPPTPSLFTPLSSAPQTPSTPPPSTPFSLTPFTPTLPTSAPLVQQPSISTPLTQHTPTPTPTPLTQHAPTPAPLTQQPPLPTPFTRQPLTPAPLTQQPLTPVLLTQQPPAPTPLTQQPPTPAPLTQQPSTPAPSTTNPVTKKGLKLSRQQLLIAQDMFKESSLSREHKALILGFMAGSRDNPYPGRDIIRIKLNERQLQEPVVTVEGNKTRTVLIETVFEMNYSNGQWRKLQFKRPVAM